jgi:hypothetical protein
MMFDSSNPFTEGEPRMIPDYAFYDDKIIIGDPLWGSHEIGNQQGDDVFFDLLDTDLVRRTLGVEQLSLDSATATMPGTANFSRWEHMWGSVAFVRTLISDTDIDPHDRLVLQLRTFLSDLGHTAYSHVGDWLSQGNGGPENQHDQDLSKLLENSGIANILKKYDIEINDVVPEEPEDWIECPAPDLCVDRVDYASREIQRWFGMNLEAHRAWQTGSFSIEGDKLVMKDRRMAKVFGKASLLLATEHWSEPVHRLQLACQQELIKRVLGHEYTGLLATNMDGMTEYHPRDLLYTVDTDITREMYFRDEFLNVLRPIMEQVGQAKRRLFLWERKEELDYFMRDSEEGFPHPLEHYGIYAERRSALPLVPSHVSIVPVEKPEDLEDYGSNPHTVDFFLPKLKPRQMDPLFYDDDGTVKRLSEEDEEYRLLAEEQARLQAQSYVGRLLVNPDTKKILERGRAENNQAWENATSRPRMKPERFRRLLADAALQTAAHQNMAIIDWQR